MEKELSPEQWSTAIEKYLNKQVGIIRLEPLQVLHRICMKKWNGLPLKTSNRHASNPNEEIVLFKIIADFDFYARNKHRFEWLISAYSYRNYGYEVYVHSYQAPEEVNRLVQIKNRITVCRRMITVASNRIQEYQDIQNKSLFPDFNYVGYKVLVEKKQKYVSELEMLINEQKLLEQNPTSH